MRQTQIPLTTAEVAKVLAVTPAAVRCMETRGAIRAIRTLSGQRLFDAAEVERKRQERQQRRPDPEAA